MNKKQNFSQISAQQILTFFKSKNALRMSSLWEKVGTYFVINNDAPHLVLFYKQVQEAIDLIESKDPPKDCPYKSLKDASDNNLNLIAELKDNLKNELDNSIALALCLNPLILEHSACKFLRYNSIIIEIVETFRKTYLFRHNYQYLRAYCYTIPYEKWNSNILGKDFIKTPINKINLNRAPYLSPVFLKPHDINIIDIFNKLSKSENEGNLLPINTIEVFRKFNYNWRKSYNWENENTDNDAISNPDFSKVESEHLEIIEPVKDLSSVKDKKETDNQNKVCEHFFCNILELKDQNAVINIKCIDVIDQKIRASNYNDKNHSNQTNKKVGIVNWKVSAENLIGCLERKPNQSKNRREDLFEVLNYSIKKKIEILVFPEGSIPVAWLPLLAEQAARHDIAIIGGLEYYLPPISHSFAYNLCFSIFPVKMKHYSTAFIVVRTKNYYAPDEIRLIEGYHYQVPIHSNSEYHLVKWRNNYFSLYNCFELSNISDRALFKSKVDYIIAIELNKDIDYFSNVAESWARDLKCFIIQSNSSDYGDTRIVSPSKSITRDIMKIKGGEFPLVLVSTLDVSGLRNHSRKAPSLQIAESSYPFYKPSPAKYEWEWVEKRINNEPLSKNWIESVQSDNSDTNVNNDM